ncbi:hypothetical protein MZD04_gp386 [Pseudomonas phage Psa21]|uniref:Uncharacterized protein n=1 Tax=Pseudomonas phage Psa21 TaxID=2530023 RepID=A0A481W5C6_9CAUD|nr:hypothetical protein MZD04_gp386 [Pseudomonas phage Psa21]QBJ02912.1 hypothetical protein PSA21_386 [Pseudomonas phage Psa21]
MYYEFTHDELPFQFNTMLRFFCKATVIRKQFEPNEHVSFSPETVVRLVVPTASEEDLQPFITASCPVHGSNLHINIKMVPERKLENRNDAIAYVRRTLCKEAIMVTERDIRNLDKHGARKHYSKDFFGKLISKCRYRMETFHTYNFYPSYD